LVLGAKFPRFGVPEGAKLDSNDGSPQIVFGLLGVLRKSILCIALLLAASIWTREASAEPIKFEFEGLVTDATGHFASTTVVSGLFSYDTAAAGTVVVAGKLIRFASPGPLDLDITVSAGGSTYSSGAATYLSHTVRIQNDLPVFVPPGTPPATADAIVFQSFDTGPVPAGSPRFFEIFFVGSTDVVFSGLPSGLPTDLNLNNFDSVGGVVRLPGDADRLAFDITRLRRTEPVPEPGTFALIGIASTALLVQRRRLGKR